MKNLLSAFGNKESGYIACERDSNDCQIAQAAPQMYLIGLYT